VSLFWLYYRRDGQFAGAAIFEAQLPIEAKVKAVLAGLPDGFDCSTQVLAESARRKIPRSMMGHLLSPAELEQLHIKLMGKKPAAASARRRDPRKKSSA
jgi:hypothetical protein